MIERITLKAENLKSLFWDNNNLIDLSEQKIIYQLDNKYHKTSYIHAYKFDAAINSPNGVYQFVYEKLGTKGLLFKNYNIIREINRPYYCAEVYEYPAVFFDFNGRTYLAHCPIEYSRIDFEDVETGEIVTNLPDRDGHTFFSRFEISPGGKYLLSKGWKWHPFDLLNLYNIEDCFNNPRKLDEQGLFPFYNAEINTASFISDDLLLVGSTDESLEFDSPDFVINGIGVWDINKREFISIDRTEFKLRNLIFIGNDLAWNLFEYPRLINIKTGETVYEIPDINSGKVQSSIYPDLTIHIAYNKQSKMLAVGNKDKIEVLKVSP